MATADTITCPPAAADAKRTVDGLTVEVTVEVESLAGVNADTNSKRTKTPSRPTERWIPGRHALRRMAFQTPPSPRHRAS